MKGKNKYGKPVSANFLRYLRGEMKGDERNSFERELQKNPFAQEAMDGMETFPAGDVQRDIGSLEQRINRMNTRRNRYTYYRIAASVAVLMIISSVFYVVERSKVSDQPSIPEYRQIPMEIEKTEPVRKAEPEEPPEAKPSPPASRPQDVSSGTERQNISQDIVSEESEEIKEPEKTEPEQELQLPVQRKALTQMPSMVENAVTGQPASAARSLDSGISPAAFAGITKAVEITFSTLEASLNEKRVSDTAGVYSPPQPLNGKEEYDRYILEHLTRPDSATAGQRVVVVAAFKVLTDGSLDSIRIVRSPGKSFSDEVLRLISNGPSWKPATRNGMPVDDEVRLNVVFR